MADSIMKGEIPPTNITLQNPDHWYDWITTLKTISISLGVWEKLDPSKPDLKGDIPKLPERPTIEQARETAINKLQITQPSGNDIAAIYQMLIQDYQPKLDKHKEDKRAMRIARAWIIGTVDSSWMQRAIAALTENKVQPKAPSEETEQAKGEEKSAAKEKSTVEEEVVETFTFSNRALVKELKKSIAPNDEVLEEVARSRYLAVLSSGAEASMKPELWLKKWQEALNAARLHGLPEVQKWHAVRAFLNAIQNRYAPEWAQRRSEELDQALQSNDTSKNLDHYGELFRFHIANNTSRLQGRRWGIHATLGGRSDELSHSDKDSSEHRSRSNNRGKPMTKCPCKPQAEHRWRPEDCFNLKAALTGRGQNGRASPPKHVCDEVKQRISGKKWASLKETLTKKGWFEDSDANANALEGRQLINAIIDPSLVERPAGEGVYSALLNAPHPLSLSTLMDNCGATHLVNDIALLQADSIVRPKELETVEAGAGYFPIIARGTRVMPKLLTGFNGQKMDLVLTNVAVVEGFHVNIISAARLRESHIWYTNFDESLRFGEMSGKSHTVLKLTRKYNLTFVEHKPLSQ
jgi:hypothetical protein